MWTVIPKIKPLCDISIVLEVLQIIEMYYIHNTRFQTLL